MKIYETIGNDVLLCPEHPKLLRRCMLRLVVVVVVVVGDLSDSASELAICEA